MVATAAARFQRDFVVRALALETGSATILVVVVPLGKHPFCCAAQRSADNASASLGGDIVAAEEVFQGAKPGKLAGIADFCGVEIAR
jgi:hypothetical protein